MKNLAIIVAGGKGSRLSSDLPKQFIELNGKPLLAYTLEQFHEFDPFMVIRVVLPKDWVDFWKKEEQKLDIDYTEIVVGGKERFDSVQHALEGAQKFDYIFVHDGARPFIDRNTIQRVLFCAMHYGTAVPFVPAVDSVRYQINDSNISLDRRKVYAVQTPQTFRADWLTLAYKQTYRKQFTDDASVVEQLGHPIHMVTGSVDNIKVTRQRDLLLARLILEERE